MYLLEKQTISLNVQFVLISYRRPRYFSRHQENFTKQWRYVSRVYTSRERGTSEICEITSCDSWVSTIKTRKKRSTNETDPTSASRAKKTPWTVENRVNSKKVRVLAMSWLLLITNKHPEERKRPTTSAYHAKSLELSQIIHDELNDLRFMQCWEFVGIVLKSRAAYYKCVWCQNYKMKRCRLYEISSYISNIQERGWQCSWFWYKTMDCKQMEYYWVWLLLSNILHSFIFIRNLFIRN